MDKDQESIEKAFNHLYEVMRSITGKGNRFTLRYLKKNFLPDAELKSICSGKEIFDWEVPPEWNVKEAYVKNKYGEKIIDIKDNFLHIVSYSSPVDAILSEKELLKKIFTLPDYPSWIPYRTSYYKKDWGFCCRSELLKSKKFVGPFTVKIDSDLNPKGKLDWLECFHKGELDDEILISTYCCHPNLANDNLSGLIAATKLFEDISKKKTRYSYRLFIGPETIGSICFLSQSNISNIKGGMVLSCVAGPGLLSIKNGFDENHWINKSAMHALEKVTNGNFIKYPFNINGSDERQYSSPGFKLVTPSIHKSKYYEYPEYHTSADNLGFISSSNLMETLEVYKKWISYIESYCKPKRNNPYCELQLGKRGLYPNIGGSLFQIASQNNELTVENKNNHGNFDITTKHIEAFRWLMHLADGLNTNFYISEKSGIDIDLINQAIAIFYKNDLITLD